MSLVTTVKGLAINTGLFRSALRLSRRLRPATLRTFLDDVHFYQALLPAGALCFDVGANLGKKSEALLRAGMRVVAFEPNPRLLPELRARCSYDSNWTLLPAAVGSGSAVATLHIRQLHGQSSLDRNQGGGE